MSVKTHSFFVHLQNLSLDVILLQSKNKCFVAILNMWDHQIIKEKFYHIAQDAENNVSKDKLKAPKAPPVYEGLHDISLARRDVYMFFATSHYPNKQDFIAALKQQLNGTAENSNAFDEQKYAEACGNYLKDLITEYQ